MGASSPARRVAKATVLVAAVLLLTLPGLAQQSDSGMRRSTGGNATCMDCHQAEGMDFVDTFPDRIQEVPAGETFTMNVTIANPWLHHIEDSRVAFDLSGTDRIVFAGGRDPLKNETTGSVSQAGESDTTTFSVRSGATEVYVVLEGDEGNGFNDWDLTLETPSGEVYNGSDDGFQDSADGNETWIDKIRLGQEEILTGGFGNWTARVTMARGSPPFNTYRLAYQVYYNASQAQTLSVDGPPRLNEGETATFTMRLKARNETGPTRIATNTSMLVTADVPQDHPPSGIPNIQDVGSWYVRQSQNVTVGDELVKQEQEVTTQVGGVNLVILSRSYAFISGFTALFLLPLTLVLGGTFGSWSVGWLNDLMGARRRVLWHNAASFLMLTVVIVHMGLFLFEPTREWTKGLLFGGGALAALSGLAVSGSFQRDMIERYGFSAWRFIHLTLAILMVLLVTLHTTVEGTDFQFVRDLFG